MEKKKIMIVEDERIVACNLARQLTDLGYDVVAAAYSGEEALDKLHLASFWVIDPGSERYKLSEKIIAMPLSHLRDKWDYT